MLEAERARELIKELMDASDGTRADDYAALLEDLNDRIDEAQKLAAQMDKANNSITLLKRENFRLFERVGATTPPAPQGESADEFEEKNPMDYLNNFIDSDGFFK